MLTFNEFIRLPQKEKCKRYCELSSYDKFLARMNDWQPNDATVIDESTNPEEIQQHEIFMEELMQAIEEGRINLIE